ncbi:GNAT family N-acetyltransferase [Rhodovulum adriaticum]|uniref:Ribosomal-protein-alanine N-acetyltransferase n=1 Tax=Rhodovulum adriaticum TaxID=35804 RepID=A0A4R2NYD1_RHOAD|nr:GNAT family N-acetyltransferase [Rhodovulum adriaticum]MBK1636984.1 ribosomal-protein-alanine acetyltransferase [Rhodovulum adriaticum]TCP26541.1 ribosomal-protein-alanine N-acetyltransferase [Rhodovulum adriaticum]
MTPDTLAALHAACFTTPRPWRAEEFAALLAGPGTFLCGDATAFALGRALAGEAELLTLAVCPTARRQGLGRARLAAFEDAARARGADTAFLEVAADNAAARALYDAAGYGQAGQRPGYYAAPDGSRIDALVLRKSLTG